MGQGPEGPVPAILRFFQAKTSAMSYTTPFFWATTHLAAMTAPLTKTSLEWA